MTYAEDFSAEAFVNYMKDFLGRANEATMQMLEQEKEEGIKRYPRPIKRYPRCKIINKRSICNLLDTHVYIGRPGFWGNPIKLNYKCKICGKIHSKNGSTLDCYKTYLLNRINNESDFIEKLKELDGKILVCWCAPNKCHGDILAEAIMWAVYFS